MLPPGGAEGASQPDLGAALEDRDDHDIRHPDAADEQCDRAEGEEQAVQRGLGVSTGDKRV